MYKYYSHNTLNASFIASAEFAGSSIYKDDFKNFIKERKAFELGQHILEKYPFEFSKQEGSNMFYSFRVAVFSIAEIENLIERVRRDTLKEANKVREGAGVTLLKRGEPNE